MEKKHVLIVLKKQKMPNNWKKTQLSYWLQKM